MFILVSIFPADSLYDCTLTEMTVLVLLLSISGVFLQCGVKSEGVTETLVRPIKSTVSSHDELVGKGLKIYNSYALIQRSSWKLYEDLTRSSHSNATAKMRAAVRESLANLSSRLVDESPELRTPAEMTEEDWDKIKARYDILRNSTMVDLSARFTEPSEKLQSSLIFEESEQQSLPGGVCETIARAVDGYSVANESVVKSVCDMVRTALSEIPSVPMPAHVWFPKWHKLTKLMLSAVRDRDGSADIRLLLRLQRFQVVKLFFGSKDFPLEARRFTLGICVTSAEMGLESVDIHSIIAALEIYLQEGFSLGPKNDWNLSDFRAHNQSRFESLEGLRMLITNSSFSHADKIDKVFSDMQLRTSVASFRWKKQLFDYIFLGEHGSPKCGQRMIELIRNVAPVFHLACSYVAMPVSDMMNMTLLARRMVTDTNSNTTGEMDKDRQCSSRETLHGIGDRERYIHASTCFHRGALQTGSPPEVLKKCGITGNQAIWHALVETGKNTWSFCKKILHFEEKTYRSRAHDRVLTRGLGIKRRMKDHRRSLLAAVESDIGRVECYYQELHLDFIKRHRQSLLQLIQTDEAGFVEVFRKDVKKATELENLLANETELIVSFVNESLSDPPQHFAPQQNLTLYDILAVYSKTVGFLDAFVKKCNSTTDVQDKVEGIEKRLYTVFSQKVVGSDDFLCENSLSAMGFPETSGHEIQ